MFLSGEEFSSWTSWSKISDHQWSVPLFWRSFQLTPILLLENFLKTLTNFHTNPYTSLCCGCRGWLQTSTNHRKNEGRVATEDQRVYQKTRGTESWSDVSSYSLYHIRSNSSLIRRCKTTLHKVVPKCLDTSAPVPKCLADISAILVPKCPGSKLS